MAESEVFSRAFLRGGGRFIDETGQSAAVVDIVQESDRILESLKEAGWRSGMRAVVIGSPTLGFVALIAAAGRLGLHSIFSSSRMLGELTRSYSGAINGVLDAAKPFPAPQSASGSLLSFDGPTFNLFTSGTTGAPKLVTLDVQAPLERSRIECEIFGIEAETRVLGVMQPSYELGLNQIFSTFYSGATLRFANSVFPDKIIEVVNEDRIQGIIATPQFWLNLLKRKDDGLKIMKPLDWLSVSGGRINQDAFDAVTGFFTGSRIVHTYGKTETGRSLYGNCADRLILDRVPGGVQVEIKNGELTHRGHCLGVDSVTGERIKVHSSGDLFDGNGKELVFKGRADNVVKYLDHRISLEEIETEIDRHPGVVQSVCAIEATTAKWEADHVLVAYIEAGSGLSIHDLKRALHDRLSAYKVPRVFRLVTSWPLTRSLKVERARLAELADWTEAR